MESTQTSGPKLESLAAAFKRSCVDVELRMLKIFTGTVCSSPVESFEDIPDLVGGVVIAFQSVHCRLQFRFASKALTDSAVVGGLETTGRNCSGENNIRCP